MKNINKVTDILKIKYPIIQGPMSWITNAEFVSAISNAGGLGVLGANAGQRFKADDPNDADKMREQIRKTQSLTHHSFAINIVDHNDATDQTTEYNQRLMQVAFEEHVKYFVTVGTPKKVIFDQIKLHDGIIIHRPMTPTIENMVASERNGADILVATGSEAGGVLPDQDVSTADVIKNIIDHVHIPVIPTGGINTTDDVEALRSYDIAGLFVGTLFITAKESPLNNKTKELIIKSRAGDMLVVSEKIRSINTKKAIYLNRKLMDKAHPFNTSAEIHRIGGMKLGMLDGDIEEGIVSVNNKIDSIRSVMPINELVKTLGEYCNVIMV
ncbi:NAD(P)H-dependent flavin oxidoreductase [Lactobacillaceae bacterium Melli_B3]